MYLCRLDGQRVSVMDAEPRTHSDSCHCFLRSPTGQPGLSETSGRVVFIPSDHPSHSMDSEVLSCVSLDIEADERSTLRRRR